MEDTTWEQKLHALTHILTSPTISLPLHSQFFISKQIPCYLNWDYPPILCNKPNSDTFPSLHLKWGISLFLKRVSTIDIRFPGDFVEVEMPLPSATASDSGQRSGRGRVE
ncbi:hypothetical protein CCACVL1_23685 [Corchorus capsularis]|uniref:Uncharacterized protein n=1 Tax=Corchorus capsularis TaxID=210143 RepID=A0A1R3GSY6_COCAP|nr:hypothetical protein CCACVL1_23685 [Corchorus capsularis]